MTTQQMTTQRVLAIVPARGGSKGLPRKNLMPVAGVPLVARAIAASRAARRVAKTVVTTDDAEIAALGAAAGAEVIERPAHLASDTAAIVPVLQHALQHLAAAGESYDAVALLEPTSPFRDDALIDRCIDKLFTGGTQTVLSVTRLERNPRYILSVCGDEAEFFVKDPPIPFQRRQEFSHLKRVNGCVYLTRTTNLLAGELIVPPIKVVEMTPEESIIIDSLFDLKVARLCAEVLGERN